MARKLSDSEKLKLCSGCKDDFYNGHNPLGVKRCWMLDEAKPVMRKIVPLDLVPPWKMKPRKVLDCYRPQRAVCVAPDRER